MRTDPEILRDVARMVTAMVEATRPHGRPDRPLANQLRGVAAALRALAEPERELT